LPSERVKKANVFEIVRIDYVGLFLKKLQKAWISLFTCADRAHLFRNHHVPFYPSLSASATSKLQAT